MTTTNAREPLARPVPPMLYPTLLLAGIAVIIASILGIAAMTGMLPQSQAVGVQSTAPAAGPEHSDGKAALRVPADAAKTTTRKMAGAVPCNVCGVVDAVRAVEAQGRGSGAGAVAGGVVGGILGNQVGGGRGRTAMTVVGVGAGAYAGHELEKNMNKSISYEIRVRMDDNSYRVFHTPQPEVGVGQRVKVRNGQLVRAS